MLSRFRAPTPTPKCQSRPDRLVALRPRHSPWRILSRNAPRAGRIPISLARAHLLQAVRPSPVPTGLVAHQPLPVDVDRSPHSLDVRIPRVTVPPSGVRAVTWSNSTCNLMLATGSWAPQIRHRQRQKRHFRAVSTRRASLEARKNTGKTGRGKFAAAKTGPRHLRQYISTWEIGNYARPDRR